MMKRPFQPERVSEEESRLANEWVSADTDLPIDKYILSRASKRFLDEYKKRTEAMKGMHFGRKVLPDGDILIYN